MPDTKNYSSCENPFVNRNSSANWELDWYPVVGKLVIIIQQVVCIYSLWILEANPFFYKDHSNA